MIRERLAQLDGLVCDLDGVVYRGDEPVPGAAEAIENLRQRGIRVVFCTNNSRSTVGQYVDKLAGVGVPAEPDEIVTSAIVTAEVLKERGFAGKTAIVVGGDGLTEALGDVCVSVKSDPDVTKADLVVVGWDPSFDYAILTRAANAVRSGAILIASNEDATFPSPEGLLPGAGAMVAAIERASGRRAEVMGKPHPPMMKVVADRLHGCKSIAIVGDRPDTDLAGARAMGWTSILVLSGVTTPADAEHVTPVPDLVLDSLAELG
ncbi:MAG TPA: HAD-IIA family hydrolase [Actinomycetota bacterium]|nr:HAD-IIA family hydrolase [Actinomycetota bacterium]